MDNNYIGPEGWFCHFKTYNKFLNLHFQEAHNSFQDKQTRGFARFYTQIGNISRYQPSIHAKMSGATIVASDSTMNLGVSAESLPHVIFSFGTAPEYDP